MEELYAKITAQIAVYSGIPDGGLAALQDMHHKLMNGKSIKCQECGAVNEHEYDCSIVTRYKEIFGE